jgi:hypothetical protein
LDSRCTAAGGEYITLDTQQSAWAIWKSRNKVAFEKKIIKHPAEIIVHAYAFMSHWAGLFSADFAGGITDGVKVMLALAHKILAHQRRGPDVKLLLAPREDQKDDEEP